jgi:hypothetical protein
MPDMVQVGNEINTELLMPTPHIEGTEINWQRNGRLINAGIKAVRDAGEQTSTSPRVMLHIAQPENVIPWFDAALAAGISDFDLIGVSYYPKWSIHSVEQAGQVLGEVRNRYNKEVMIVETAYPWTQSAGLAEPHLLGGDATLPDYPATPQGQRRFLIDLTKATFKNGGTGVIYWEPAWVSTPCRTLWGQGSHWENATFFDFNNVNEVLPAIDFLGYEYTAPVEVTFSFRFEGEDQLPEEIYFWGDFTGQGRRLLPLPLNIGEYSLRTRLLPDTEFQYQFYQAPSAAIESALSAAECIDEEGYLNGVVPADSVAIQLTVDNCPVIVDAD